MSKIIERYNRSKHGTHHLLTAAAIADPRSYIDRIAELPPLFYDQIGAIWVCSGYDESVKILSDSRTFSSARIRPAAELDGRGHGDLAAIADLLSAQLLFSDPPHHTRVRGALRGQFSPASVNRRHILMRQMAQEMLGNLPENGRLDLIEEFADPLSAKLIGDLLGMTHRAADLRTWADSYDTLLGSLSALPAVGDASVGATIAGAIAALREVVQERRSAPGNDLISHLIETLPREPLIGLSKNFQNIDDAFIDIIAANALVLVAGGYQTLTHLISTGLILLAQNPSQLSRLRADPGLIEHAINEIMRFDGSSQYLGRRAAADVSISGAEIKAGDNILVLLNAANFDENRFPASTVFDIERKQASHLGFGRGPHYCIGAPYAEFLAGEAITGFLERYPAYRLVDDSVVEWGPHSNTRCRVNAWVVVERKTGSGPPTTETSVPVAVSSARAGTPSRLTGDVVDMTGGRATDPELHVIKHVWNDSAVSLGAVMCWHHIFEQRARAFPERVAVEYDNIGYSYRQIDERANAVANQLRHSGVEPEVTVAVCMNRTAEMIVAVLAIAKAGGSFMLAEAECPKERFRLMLADASVRLVLTDVNTFPKLAEQQLGAEILCITGHECAEVPPVTGVRPGNTAYVVFSSGTTGRPKAIANSHESLAALHVAQRRVFALGPTDRVAQVLSLNFDGCISEFVLALLSGATLLLGRPQELVVGPPLARFLKEKRVTVAIMTPTMWSFLPGGATPDIRVAAFAGEDLDGQLVRQWSAPGRRVLNLYGPAEAGIWSTFYECDSGEARPAIGRPVSNKRVYVMNEKAEPVGPGCAGELYIGGIGIGRYLGRPDLMRDRFMRDTFSESPDQLLYRTGDICRWRPDGALEFCGRADRQVKIRGQRVELEEVERILAGAPGVSACAVMVRGGELHAAVVARSGDWAEKPVIAYLRDRVHTGMVPRTFELVSQLTLAPTGKSGLRVAGQARTLSGVDDAELRDLCSVSSHADSSGGASRRELEAAEGHLERFIWVMARLFAKCLRLSQAQVKVGSDFFSLGGDSLALTELLVGIESEFGMVPDLESLLDSSTPLGIAQEILTSLAHDPVEERGE